MKRLLPILLSGVLLTTFGTRALAQYVIKEADAQYELFDYVKAINLYEQAYKKKATLHAAEQLASCYSLVQNYKEAESWYAIAVGMPGSKSANVLNYAKALQNNAKYNEAKDAYIKYASLDEKVTARQKDTWIKSCDSAQIWMKRPRHVTIDNLKALNSPQSDWGAVNYQNGIVFASDRANSEKKTKDSRPFLKFDKGHEPDKKVYGWTGNGYLRLYEQKEKSGSVTLFPVTINTDYHVGSASFTADGNEMYFTLTRIPPRTENIKGKPATINIEIYNCTKDTDGTWSAPAPFEYNKVNEYSVGDPYISKDGSILYFVSNMPGGKGGTDIYYCKKNSIGKWDSPVNMAALNTSGNERTPCLDSENNFYFSSDSGIGFGGLDIFEAQVTNGRISAIKNMGYPFNSPQDDFAFSPDDPFTGYLASNRMEGQGSDDIYRFTLQKIINFKLEGIVYDKRTKEPLSNALVSLKKTDGMPLKVQTDANGRFNFDLQANSAYDLHGEKTGFRNDGASVSTIGLTTTTILKKDLYLEKIVLNEEIVLKNIYYDFDKANIRPDAAVELDKLVKILQDNPTVWIELGSHTDSRGNDQYNQWLSQRRANSAVQYIIDRGINKNRITAKGYGESRPVNGCINGMPCTETEHQLNRRTEFKIVKY